MSVTRLKGHVILVINLTRAVVSGLQLSVCNNYFSYFSTKTYVVGTQKNRLNEKVLLNITAYVEIDGMSTINKYNEKKNWQRDTYWGHASFIIGIAPV